MNKFYKLLALFNRDEPRTKKSLLRSYGITIELIDEAEECGYIRMVEKSDVGEIRYMITQVGIQIRDS